MLQRASHTAQPFVYGAIMEAMREAWTDERLDYLNHRVDDGFKRVDERFKRVDERFEQVDKRFDKVDKQFERLNDRVDDLFRLMAQIGAGIVVALIGLIATQL
jgi:archaellum component FlaC